MDRQVITQPNVTCQSSVTSKHKKQQQGTIMFTIIKNIIIQQNTLLLKTIAQEFDIDETHLLQTYIKPEYYLPTVLRE